MNHQEEALARKIPGNIDEVKDFYGYSFRDIVVLAGPAVIIGAIITYAPVNVGPFAIPLVAVGVFLGYVLMKVAPPHIDALEWVHSMWIQFTTPDKIHHVSDVEDTAIEQTTPIENNIYGMSKRTQEYVGVEKIHTGANAIEREDGVMVGAIKVNPTNMALADKSRWNNLVSRFAEVLNNNVDFRMQIYGTTTTFPVNDYLENYQERLQSPDIQDKPIMKSVLVSFLDWYSDYLSWQGMHQRDYYIIVAVAEDEIHTLDQQQETIMQQLGQMRFFKKIFKPIANRKESLTEDERKQNQIQVLRKRLSALESGVRNLNGCNAEPVSAAQHAVLLKEYWSGTELDIDPDAAVRTQGVITRSDDPVSPEELKTPNNR